MRILIANDGGQLGEKALATVAGWSQRSAAEVHIVEVLKPSAVHETARPTVLHAGTPGCHIDGADCSTQKSPLRLLRRTAPRRSMQRGPQRWSAWKRQAAKYLPGVAVTSHAVVGADPAREIIALATTLGTEMVVVGAHGRTGMSHAFLGSVSEAVVRNCPVPVLVVGPHVA